MEVWKEIKFNIICFLVAMITVMSIIFFFNYSYGYNGSSKKIKILYCEELPGFEICVACIEGYKYVIVDKEKRRHWAGMGITQMFEAMGMHDHLSVPVSCK